MENANIRKLLTLIHRGASPENRAFVHRQLAGAGFTISDLYQNMEMEEPYVECHRVGGLPSLPVPEHSHRFCEILCCLNSFDGGFQVGQEQYRIQRGDVVIIPPGIVHGFDQENTGMLQQGIILWLSEDYLRIMRDLFPGLVLSEGESSGGILRTAGTLWESLVDLFRGIAGEAEARSPGWEAAVSGLLTLLLTQMGRAAVDLGLAPRRGDKPELLDMILAYVESNLTQKITLEDTAKRFWVSQSTITHLFHEKMEVSFYKYVTSRRLAEAKNLILEGMALEKVAARVGFGDYSAFYRAFKSEFGVSPREFRKQTDTAQNA